MIHFVCPNANCNNGVKVLSDKYPPSCNNHEAHHHNRGYLMERK